MTEDEFQKELADHATTTINKQIPGEQNMSDETNGITDHVNFDSDMMAVIKEKVGVNADDVRKLQDQRTLQALAASVGGTLGSDDMFVNRTDGLQQVSKPPSMSLGQLSKDAAKQAEYESETIEIPRRYLARPADLGIAFTRVLKAMFGFAPKGEKTFNPFTGEPIYPDFEQVLVGYETHRGRRREVYEQVPKGYMSFERSDLNFKMVFWFQPDEHDKYGYCGKVTVRTNKGSENVVKGLMDAVESYIQQNSIYRGKVMEGAGKVVRDPYGSLIAVEPTIIDIETKPEIKLWFEKGVDTHIHDAIDSIISNTEAHKKDGTKIGSTVILGGEPGTGKTEAMIRAARLAMANKETVDIVHHAKSDGNRMTLEENVTRPSWTVIYMKPDEDLTKVVQFAKNVGGYVLLVGEDFEGQINHENPEVRSRLLNVLDGMDTKGTTIMKVLTTNTVDAFADKTGAMMRGERIDDTIIVGLPDREAALGHIGEMVPESRREKDGVWDEDAIWKACDGYTLAWITSGVRKSKRAAVARTGKAGNKLTSDDVVAGLITQRPAFQAYQEARGKNTKPWNPGATLMGVLSLVETFSRIPRDGSTVEGVSDFVDPEDVEDKIAALQTVVGTVIK